MIRKKQAHIITELAGVASGIYLIGVSGRVRPEYKWPLFLIGLGGMVIDTAFLLSW